MSRKIVEISYLISKKESVMPGTIRPPVVRARSRMVERPEGVGETETRWGSYNSTSFIEMCTHTGTHIDAPFHIDPQGLTVDSFEIEEFIFDNPLLINLPKGDLEKITKDDLSPYRDELERSDLLLVYTGFCMHACMSHGIICVFQTNQKVGNNVSAMIIQEPTDLGYFL